MKIRVEDIPEFLRFYTLKKEYLEEKIKEYETHIRKKDKAYNLKLLKEMLPIMKLALKAKTTGIKIHGNMPGYLFAS